MAIPKFLDDLNIISKLGDYPRSDDGLSTMQFKAKFDEGVLKMQKYLNDVLIPYMNQLVDVQALLNGILDSTLSLADKAANAKATGAALDRKLDKTGGNVTGNIDMGGKRVVNLGNPVSDGDVVCKKYLEDYASTKEVPLTLLASGWSSAAPYTQTVQVTGLTDQLRCEVFPNWPDNAETEKDLQEEAAKISSCRRSGTQVTFRCLDERPAADIPIIVEVHV
ncbi:MAG: hypothetical protein J6Q53_04880 [Oscillospiraceae bacterium]|nr:hypothetical protein [Oscillospiraceae bacterium]